MIKKALLLLPMALMGLSTAPLAQAEHAPKEWWNSAQNGGITYPERWENGHHYVKRDGHWILVHDE